MEGRAFVVRVSMTLPTRLVQRGVAKVEDFDPTSSRAVTAYLRLDDAAFGGATPVEPKSISPD